MDTLKLIYNPFSGDKQFKNTLDTCVEAFYEGGYETQLLRATSWEALDHSIANMDCAAVVVAGGDGTVNLVVNSLKRHGKDVPLGIIPAGTANDFAAYLKMPKDPGEAAEAIMKGRVMRTDLGRVNGQYFINVCGAGMLTNVSQQVDTQIKDALGKFAYYLKGIGQLPNFEPFPLRITTPSRIVEDEFFLIIVLNGGGAGGFERLSPGAKIDDGLLDFIALRAISLMDVAALFLKVMSGDYLDDRRVLFLREQSLRIEHIGSYRMNTDTDGERGPDMPIDIVCEKESQPIFVPLMYR